MTNKPEGEAEVVIRSPKDLVMAINSMLLQMNRKQRKGFLQWVKQKRTQYDFQYPQGYQPPKEAVIVEEKTAPTILVPQDVTSSEKVEIIKP